MPSVYVDGRPVTLVKQIGKGGEAEVYLTGDGKALKLYKHPDHIDYRGKPAEQETARRRLAAIGRKLRDLPQGLPDRVVTPIDLVTDQTGQRVLGFTMSLLRDAEVLHSYSIPRFREDSGFDMKRMTATLIGLHETFGGLHRRDVVMGDCNDLNVMVVGSHAYVVDIDASQFGSYLNIMFSKRFVDPLLCALQSSKIMLVKPHTTLSDWYAYTIMAFQSLLYIGPYGGTYRNKANPNVSLEERPSKRITVFDSHVIYPKAAVPYGVLPDDLLHHFHEVFERDLRVMFPLNLLSSIRWTLCASCGVTHARTTCPICSFVSQVIQMGPDVQRGTVRVQSVFQTSGRILFATVQSGKVVYLYHENDQYMRETGLVVRQGPLVRQNRFRIRGSDTLVGHNGRVEILGSDPETMHVDGFGELPVFDATGKSVFWTDSGELKRTGRWGPERIGNVISGQTLFWVGSTFGLGFYNSGNVSIHFVFDAERTGINDSVNLPLVRGQLIDSTAVFTDSLCWFFTSSREGPDVITRCSVIKRDGSVLGTLESANGAIPWLNTIRGKCASSDFLLSGTDSGIIRIKVSQGTLVVDREFPDTEPFVDSDTLLLAASDGLYAVTKREVKKITIR